MRRPPTYESRRPPLVAVVGPTAVGKTEIAVRLCMEHGGEIVSADSRQVYVGLDVASAKASPEQRAAVPHHLLDLLPPDRTITLATFQDMAYARIREIHARGTVPFLVGGTGQWIKAVIEGWNIPRVPPDMELRAELLAEAETIGAEAMHARLAEVDPEAASRIDYRNVRRVVRALEVYVKSGRPISEQQRKKPPPYRLLIIGLTMSRERLYERIDRRVDKMAEMGMVEEVRRLVDRGYALSLPAMSGLGYKQVGMYVAGEVSLEEALRLVRKETRRFARQQYNWFRLDDPSIRWFDLEKSGYDEVSRVVAGFLS